MDLMWAPWRQAHVTGAAGGPGCFFCRAADGGEDPGRHLLLARRPAAFAMLNRYPYASGHLMVSPVRHIASLEVLSEEEALDCWRLLAAAQRAVAAALAPHGFNIGVNQGKAGGAGVADHLHIHLVPRWEGDHNFMTVAANTRVAPMALEDVLARIRSAWKEPADGA